MRPLKEQGCTIVSYQLNAGRPPRVLSAPPLLLASVTSSSSADLDNKDVISNLVEENELTGSSKSNETSVSFFFLGYRG